MDHQRKHTLPRDCAGCGEYVYLVCERDAAPIARAMEDGSTAWSAPGPACGWGDHLWHHDCLFKAMPWRAA